MNVVTAVSSNELFGGAVPDEVRPLIDAARAAPRESVSAILWTAQALAPSCLATYYLLYKFHASRGELDQAERAAVVALREAGAQSGLPGTDELALSSFSPSVEFALPSAARFWLFTLKALAFIRLRKGEVEAARRLLDLVAQCDPTHSVGSDVTSALLAAVERDQDHA